MNKDDFKSDKPKRHRRTRKELEAAGYYDRKNDNKKAENNKHKLEDFFAKKQELEEKNNKITEKVESIKENLGKMKTIAEVCEEQIQRAKDKKLPQPDFDYRKSYEKGQIIYYIDINELVGKKELLELKISSVYPRAIIAYEDRGMGYTIGYEDEDMIFSTRKEAESIFATTKVESKLEDYLQRQKQLANKRKREREKADKA